MAYSTKYRCTHKTKTGPSETTVVIEILQDGYSGTVTEILGTGDVYQQEVEQIDPTDPFAKPAQKGRLEFYPLIQDASDLGILEEIFGSDESEYLMRRKVNGSVVWTGAVITDMLSYSEGPYPFLGKIVAKDLTRLSGFTFPLFDLVYRRKPIIETIAALLDNLGLGLDIYTYTSWTEAHLLAGDDFLGNIYNDEVALRTYASTGDETDQPIKHDKILDKILRNYGLILRQDDNAWRLYQLTAFENPTSIKEYRYDSTGTFVSAATKDMTIDIDRVARYILPSSVNMFNPAVKTATVRFDHRTTAADPKMPEKISFEGTDSKSFSFEFIPNGQELELAGKVYAYYSENYQSGFAEISIQIGSYYFDGTVWTTSVSVIRVEVQGGGLQQGSSYVYVGWPTISTPPIPGDASSPLKITVENAMIVHEGVSYVADKTSFEYFKINVVVPEEAAKSLFIDYEITQSGNYSKNYDHGEVWFGDGPVASARSALRHADGTITKGNWMRKGETTPIGFFRLLLREIMDTQRSNTRNLDGRLWGQYSPNNLISYNGATLFFMGGVLTGKENTWDANFLELNIQADG